MSQPKHLTQEADIGSGERSPGQKETDQMIEQVPSDPSPPQQDTPGKTVHPKQDGANAQSGNPP